MKQRATGISLSFLVEGVIHNQTCEAVQPAALQLDLRRGVSFVCIMIVPFVLLSLWFLNVTVTNGFKSSFLHKLNHRSVCQQSFMSVVVEQAADVDFNVAERDDLRNIAIIGKFVAIFMNITNCEN